MCKVDRISEENEGVKSSVFETQAINPRHAGQIKPSSSLQRMRQNINRLASDGSLRKRPRRLSNQALAKRQRIEDGGTCGGATASKKGSLVGPSREYLRQYHHNPHEFTLP